MATRTSIKKNPYNAVALSRMATKHQEIVKGLWELTVRSGLDKYFWPGSGWRTGSLEHSSGTAIDWIVVEKTGLRPSAEERKAALFFVDWLVANSSILGIEGLIFSKDGKDRPQIWGYSRPGIWRNGLNRGSVSGNHIDHIHIKFKTGASWPAKFNTGKLNFGVTVPAAAKAKPTKPTKTVPAFPKGLAPGKSNPSAVALQNQLMKAGFLAKNTKTNANYGPKTQAAVIAFHKKYPQFRSAGKVSDPAIGPKGWKYLFETW